MKQLRQFLIIVFLLSIPLWLVGYLFDATKIIPIKLPVSALQFLCVLWAAIIVTKRNGHSVSSLLFRGLDVKRINNGLWLYVAFILMPLTVFVSYLFMQWNGLQPPNRLTPLFSLPIFLIVYGISSYCEELGWAAIATDQLLVRFNVVVTGFIVGLIWAIWHIIPFMQTHNSGTWIVWQCTFSIIFRILMTKVYIYTNRSVFAVIVLHLTYDTGFSMMPYYGSSYNPAFMCLAASLAAVIVFSVGGWKTKIAN